MASSGDSFIGKWKILEWHPESGQGLQGWLVKKHTNLRIRPATTDTYTLHWVDKDNGICTIAPPLSYSNGQLVGSDRSHVEVSGKPNIPLEKGLAVAFMQGKKEPTLIVSLAGGIGEGDPGTFIAEARPGEEEEPRRPPGCLSGLLSLFRFGG